MSGAVPYPTKRSDQAVLKAFAQEEKPSEERPTDVSDELWSLALQCFSYEPPGRPAAKDALNSWQQARRNSHSITQLRVLLRHFLTDAQAQGADGDRRLAITAESVLSALERGRFEVEDERRPPSEARPLAAMIARSDTYLAKRFMELFSTRTDLFHIRARTDTVWDSSTDRSHVE